MASFRGKDVSRRTQPSSFLLFWKGQDLFQIPAKSLRIPDLVHDTSHTLHADRYNYSKKIPAGGYRIMWVIWSCGLGTGLGLCKPRVSFLAWLQALSFGLWTSYLISPCLNFSSGVWAVLVYLTFREFNQCLLLQKRAVCMNLVTKFSGRSFEQGLL